MTDHASAQHPLPWVARTPLHHLLGLALAVGGLLTVLLNVLPLPVWSGTGVVDAVQVGVIACAVRACAARRHRESGRGRRGWTLIGLGFALVGVSVACGAVLALGFQDPAPVAWRDALSGLGLLLFAAGLVALCGGAPLTSRTLSGVDTLMTAGACLFVVWQTLLVPPAGSGLSSRERVLYGDLGGITVMLMLALLLAARWRGDGRTLALLGSGLGLEALVLVGLGIASSHGHTVPLADPRVGMAFPVGTALLGLAAAQRPTGPRSWSPMRRQWDLALGLPVASVLVVSVTGALVHLSGRPWDPASVLLAGGVGLLLFVRQGLTLLENRRLTLGLEQLVTARTQELEESRRHFRDVVQHSSDVIAVLSSDGSVTYCSPAVTAMLGYRVDDVRGRWAADLVHPEDAVSAAALVRALAEGEATTVLACRVRHADGSWRSIEANVARSSVVREDQTWVVNVRDVTDRTLLEERLRHQAFHDPLTGLANRALVQERMRQALSRARRTGEPTALVFVDLDHFKRLNDTAGHSAGDAALVHVADVIRDCIRPEDTAARLGGDEFAVLLEHADEAEGAAVAERIVAALRQLPLPRQAGHVTGASVGVSVVHAGRGDGETLLRDADVAMYQAKSGGRGRAAVFDPTMREELVRELALESALHKALSDSELSLVYQPIVDLRSGAVAALEALVRWDDAQGRPVPPSAFVPLAERVGLIGALDRWVLLEACRYVAVLGDRCPELGQVAVNVNVSARDLEGCHDLEQWVGDALALSGLPPERLVLEITETAVLPDLDTLSAPLAALRSTGVRVSLDDFGTGYSSLTSLEQLPLDEIKIDGSFVAGMTEGDTAARVVEGILGMARVLDLPVVAEAVETPEQAALLRRMHCELAQGRLFAAPMGPDALERWGRTSLGAA